MAEGAWSIFFLFQYGVWNDGWLYRTSLNGFVQMWWACWLYSLCKRRPVKSNTTTHTVWTSVTQTHTWVIYRFCSFEQMLKCFKAWGVDLWTITVVPLSQTLGRMIPSGTQAVLYYTSDKTPDKSSFTSEPEKITGSDITESPIESLICVSYISPK